MARINPFVGNDVEGGIWEKGYLAGFAEPEVDHFLPIAPELVGVYQTGEQAGREDRNSPPASDAAGESSEGWSELGEHVGIHALGYVVDKAFKITAGGLISLVIMVVGIPGDVQLRPLEPEWSGPEDQEGDTYLAMCPRTDHPMVTQSVTTDGYWTGAPQSAFADADAERSEHGHAEAIVARCSLEDNTCGVVWPSR